jgi:murein DD-endopeptidase MepM/ murein hydrolase activator NlpD
VGYKSGYGRTVIIKHQGRYTLYAHLSRILVSHGDYVSQGHTIGKVGATGNAKGPHLHFEIRNLANKTIDPLLVLPKKRLLARN